MHMNYLYTGMTSARPVSRAKYQFENLKTLRYSWLNCYKSEIQTVHYSTTKHSKANFFLSKECILILKFVTLRYYRYAREKVHNVRFNNVEILVLQTYKILDKMYLLFLFLFSVQSKNVVNETLIHVCLYSLNHMVYISIT